MPRVAVVVGDLDRVADAVQAERPDRRPVAGDVADRALRLGHAQLTGHRRRLRSCGRLARDMARTRTPRRAPSSSAECRLRSASIVARVTLTGLVEPWTLARMSWMPGGLDDGADGAAGDDAGALGGGLEHAPCSRRDWTRTSCGIVVPTIGIRIRFFFASSTPLRIASGTSPALPRPDADVARAVTDDDDRAEAEPAAALDDLGDAVDLDDALLERELVGVDPGQTLAPSDQKSRPASRAASASDLTRPWYRNPARSKTTRSTPAALARSATSRPTTAASSVLVALRALELLLDGRGGGERPAGRVVDDLGVDVVEAAEHREARPLRASPPGGGGSARGACVVRRRGWRPASSCRSSVARCRLLLAADLAGLAGLAADVLARVADALALVRLGLAGRADLRGDLADELLVDARRPRGGSGSRPRS